MFSKITYLVKRHNKIKDSIKLVLTSLYYPKILFAALIKPFCRVKNPWLITEMGSDAKDNGLAFFEFINKHHPEVNSYYILNRDSAVLSDVEEVGKVVIRGSIAHTVLTLKAKYLIDTHDHYVLPVKWADWSQFKVLFGWLNPKLKFVFLQHGIMLSDASKNSAYGRTKFDYFVTSTQREYEEIISYGYPVGKVVQTGIPRFDKLYGEYSKTKKRQILLSPTWRQYLVGVSENDFVHSDYFQNIQGLLTSVELHDFLLKNNLVLKFMPPHHEIQKYLHLFYEEPGVIEHVDIDKIIVRDILMESSLMISDYSSITMDFAYMKKPIIYYQFDQAAFQSGHYKTSYFEYERDGFGPVVRTADQVLAAILDSANANFNLSVKYKSRNDDFFNLRDRHNSERLFKILNHE